VSDKSITAGSDPLVLRATNFALLYRIDTAGKNLGLVHRAYRSSARKPRKNVALPPHFMTLLRIQAESPKKAASAARFLFRPILPDAELWP
jgi:hypothetical protein